MSRIDEAMRRAALAPVVELNRAGAAADSALGLDQYPVEERATPEARVERTAATDARVKPAASRPAAAIDRLIDFGPGLAAKLVSDSGVSPLAVEQYRRLAAVLHEHQMERQLKVLMVTSALPGEGKTLTVVNLALTLSQSFERRVLLIDADLRKPSLHGLFRLSNATGLSHVLDGRTDTIPLVDVGRRLSVLPAGGSNGNPMAGLTSPRMMALLNDAAARFDWVLLDAPPVHLLPDAQLLAREAGAVVFVIKANSTSFEVVNKAVTSLGRDYIVGTVMNRIRPESLPVDDSYYHYYSHAIPAGE